MGRTFQGFRGGLSPLRSMGEPPGPEGRGEGDGRDGAAAGGEDGLLGALADGGGEEGLETDGGLLGRFMPE